MLSIDQEFETLRDFLWIKRKELTIIESIEDSKLFGFSGDEPLRSNITREISYSNLADSKMS